MYKVATLTRLQSNETITLGSLTVFNEIGGLFELSVVELPWNWNQQSRSCIPLGSYALKKHYSKNLGDCFLFDKVPNRTEVCIHSANYVHQLEGCLAPGLTFTDIDGDGIIDVTNSRQAMNALLEWGGAGFTLNITGVAG